MTIAAAEPHEQISANQGILFPVGEPYSDEPPLETYEHLQQLIELLTSLEWFWDDRSDFFAAGNLTVFYSPKQRKSEFFRGPDFFVVLDTERRSRRSWTVWQEDGKYPNVIVEILSDSTADKDKGLKKQIYQDIWRTPYYFWVSPDGSEFEGFQLVNGQYQTIPLTPEGWRWCEALQLYLGVYRNKLRFFTPDGNLVPTPKESAYQEREQAAREREQAARERQRAERLTAQLRSLGVDPE